MDTVGALAGITAVSCIVCIMPLCIGIWLLTIDSDLSTAYGIAGTVTIAGTIGCFVLFNVACAISAWIALRISKKQQSVEKHRLGHIERIPCVCEKYAHVHMCALCGGAGWYQCPDHPYQHGTAMVNVDTTTCGEIHVGMGYPAQVTMHGRAMAVCERCGGGNRIDCSCSYLGPHCRLCDNKRYTERFVPDNAT